MKSEEKWPAKFEVIKISESILREILNIYLIVCVANKNQIATPSKMNKKPITHWRVRDTCSMRLIAIVAMDQPPPQLVRRAPSSPSAGARRR